MRLHFLTVLLILFTTPLPAQVLPLPSTWKFTLSDSAAFSAEIYSDRHWENIQVSSSWEKQGHPGYNGAAWYRVQFTAPASWTKQEIVLFAGTIDDADETWLNGVRIGATGQFPPNDQSAWDQQRQYTIPKGLLKTVNTLAVRVYDGTGDGGIYGGRLALQPKKEVDKALRRQLKSKKSYDYLTTSNGLISAVYNARTGVVEAVYPYIFSAIDSGVFVQPFVRNIRLVGTDARPVSAGYCQNTHVIEVKYPKFSVFYFAPFATGERILYAVVRGDPEKRREVRFEAIDSHGLTIESNIKSAAGNAEYIFKFTAKGINTIVRFDAPSPVETEINYMQQVFARCHFPPNLSKKERALAEQSVAILKMAQAGDYPEFPLAKGQILASLRPGVWAIAWVRDAAYSIMAFSALGLYEEARAGLEFMLKAAPSNQYKHYVHSDGHDYGIGVDYQISVTRYFGNGREESDFNDQGPNIEIDDFGLFLMAFCDYVEKSGDTGFYEQWQPVLETKVADAIVHNIGADSLIRRDSGPWEHHLPGQRYAFTSGVCAMGLKAFAALQKSRNRPADKYLDAAEKLHTGILNHMLYENRVLAGAAEDNNPENHYFYDASTFELFAGGLVQDPPLFQSHLAAYNPVMRVSPGRGYIRVRSNDSYENQEWPFAGLRLAVAHQRFGNHREAKNLIRWVTDVAAANHNQIPEILGNENAAYKGAIPMVGYGAGAWILGILGILGF